MTNLPFLHKKNKQLSEVSTLGIGGPARYFAEAHTLSEMQEMVTYAHQHALPLFILGKGSNSLFDDRGFDGLVVLNRLDHLEQKEGKFKVGSGYSFARLGKLSARRGWTGLEFASGIPATVGGAIYMNAGANGQETADTLSEVTYVTLEGELTRYPKNTLEFGYRNSPFQKWCGAIVEGVFQLNSSPAAKGEQKGILDYRLKTQPYKDKSAGCAFRNPEGEAAGRLIEECGLKGACVGGACVSELHANFIVNRKNATAQDVLDLMEKIKEAIYQKKGIQLKEEIRYIPRDGLSR